jgi:transposase
MAARHSLPDLEQLDFVALKTLILAQHQQLLFRDNEIEHLRLLIAKLRRMQFGRSSEKLDRQIEQLELRLDELETAHAGNAAPYQTIEAATAIEAKKPTRKPLPEYLPREVRKYTPAQEACPDCGGALKHLGNDVSETLEYVPQRFKVIRQVRTKLACAGCDKIVQADAPSRPIPRGIAGPGLLAHVLVSKFCDHLPLYRQAEIYAREGVELDRSTLADWVGATSSLLTPLVEALRHHVMAGHKLHGDDTPVPVLAPGNGKTKTGRLWTYVRDDRPAGDTAPAASLEPELSGIRSPEPLMKSGFQTLSALPIG